MRRKKEKLQVTRQACNAEQFFIKIHQTSIELFAKLNYGHFAPWSFCSQSLRPNQESVRYIVEVTSLHSQRHFTPCKKISEIFRELFVLMLKLD